MRAVVVTSNGGPEVLELRDVPEPELGAGGLLVDVEAAGVNYRDIYEREGGGPYGGNPPFSAGVEGAGTVAALGDDIHDFAVGDRVAWTAAQGSYAERVAVPAGVAVPIPADVPTEVAAAVLLQGMTAHYLAVSTYPIQPGDSVLVHAGAGGVGLLLIQIAKSRGGRVIATTSSKEKAELARGAGADDVIGYDDFGRRVSELTAGEGVAAVYDAVGRATFDESLASLRPRGTMVLYGAASGRPGPLDPARLNSGGSLFLTRPSLPHYTASRKELLQRAGDVFDWVASDELRVRIGGRYPLGQARQAQEDLESRATTGKLILLPGADG